MCMICSVLLTINIIKMNIQREISLKNAISYCIENNDVNTATNKIIEFIRDEREQAINYTHSSKQLKEKYTPTFEEWVESKGYEVHNIHYYIRKDKLITVRKLRKKYEKKILNL